MQSSFTPGPWAIYVNAPSDVVIRKMSKDGYELCAIARVSSGYANARLIAAAPELLEALQWYEAKAVQMGRAAIDQDSKLLLELMKEIAVEYGAQARAAIAKATGENT